MPENKVPQNPKSIVLVDDDLIVREVVKIFLSIFEENLDKRLDVYTSANGLEGLGLAVAVSPDLVVIDSTLPKYSGNDLIDFIISNSKFRRHESRVIVIYQDDKPEGLPRNCVLLSKRDKGFFNNLLLEISRGLRLGTEDLQFVAESQGLVAGDKHSYKSSELSDTEINYFKRKNKYFSFKGDLAIKLGKLAGKFSNKSEQFNSAIKRKTEGRELGIFKNIYGFVVSGLNKALAVAFLFLMFVLSGGRVRDQNIEQVRADRRDLRAKYYPPVLVILIFVVNFWIQLVLFASGGVVLFDTRFKSVFAVQDMDTRVAIDLDDGIYDTNRLELVEGGFVLKQEPPEDVGDSKQEIEEKLEEEYGVEIPEEGGIIEGEPEATEESEEATQDTEPNTETDESDAETQEQLEEGQGDDAIQEESTQQGIETQEEGEITESDDQENLGESEEEQGTTLEDVTEGVLGENIQNLEAQKDSEMVTEEDSQAQSQEDLSNKEIQYYSDSPSIVFNQEIEYSELLNLLEESSFNDLDTSVEEFDEKLQYDLNNNISYQLSPDKEVWYYFSDDDMWEETEAESVSSNIVQEVNEHLDEYEEQVGGGVLYLKAFFNSDGETLVKLDRLIVERDIKLVDNLTRKKDITEMTESSRGISAPNDTLERNTLDSTDPYIDDMTPVILNATYNSGKKVVGGRVDFSGDGEISTEDLEDYVVQVYYTSSTDQTSPAVSVDDLIGETSLEKITKNGEPQYVFEMREPEEDDGYIAARVKIELDGGSEEYSILSYSVRTDYFYRITVVESGDQSDASPGDGSCDYDLVTHGHQCTLRAAMEELHDQYGSGDIHFNIPKSDPGCLSFVDNGGPGYNSDASEVHCLDPTSDSDISWWRIAPLSQYDKVTEDLYLTGSSQPGYVENTNSYPETVNGQPVIEIECSNSTNCFIVEGRGVDVVFIGLVVNSASNSNIHVKDSENTGGAYIESCYIGADISGTKAKNNTDYGIEALDGVCNLRGSSIQDRNMVVGTKASIYLHTSIGYTVFESKGSLIGVLNDGSVVNSETAIWVENYSFADLKPFPWEEKAKNIVGGGDLYGSVYFNNITDSSLLYSKGNIITGGKNGVVTGDHSGRSKVDLIDTDIFNHTEDGVNIGSGGVGEIVGSKIYDNGDSGIELSSDSTSVISQNSIYNNDGLGVDLNNDGVTLNDQYDPDTGPNDLQNYPVLREITTDSDSTQIDYDFSSQSGSYLIEFYRNSTKDSSNYGEGEEYFCSDIVTRTSNFDDSIYVDCTDADPVPLGQFVTATATKCADSNCDQSGLILSSEFSEAVPVSGPPIVNSTGDDGDTNSGDDTCYTGNTNSEGNAECTFRAAIEETNSTNSSYYDIEFNIPESDPGCLSFVDNGGDGYDPDAAEVHCLDASADPDIKWWRMSPSTEIPYISRDRTLDATTQTGFVANSNSYPDLINGQPVIELTCSGLNNCLTVEGEGSDVYVQGFVINSAIESNIYSYNTYSGGGSDIVSSFIGTDISGTKVKGSTNYGVKLMDGVAQFDSGYWSKDYEPEGRSLVVGNISSVSSTSDDGGSILGGANVDFGRLITGEVVSSDATIMAEGAFHIRLEEAIVSGGDTYGGVYYKSDPTSVYSLTVEDSTFESNLHGFNIEGDVYSGFYGDGAQIKDSIISNNTDTGITITGENSSVSFQNNSIYNNGGLGIDLGGDGVTANDSGDLDIGPNGLQNYPWISGSYTEDTSTYIDYHLYTSVGYYKVDFYYNKSKDSSGYGEGRTYLCSDIVYVPNDSLNGFDITCDSSNFPNAPSPVGSFISSTLTKCSNQDCNDTDLIETSEFSESLINGGAPTVNSTGDGGDIDLRDDTCYTGGVNSEGDSECTLRAAIELTNEDHSYDEIEFDIPESDPGCLSFVDNGGSGYDPDAIEVHCLDPTADPDIKWWRISPSSELPHFDGDRHVYADTQPGYISNTNDYPEYLNGQPVVEVVCDGLQRCLTVEGYGADVVFKGFVVNSANYSNFSSYLSPGGGPEIHNVYVGTDISGTKIKGNTDYGLEIYGGQISVGRGTILDTRGLVVGEIAPVFLVDPGGDESRFYSEGGILGRLNDGQVASSDSGIIMDGVSNVLLVRTIVSGGNSHAGIYGKSSLSSEWSGFKTSNSTISSNLNGIHFENIPYRLYSNETSALIRNNIIKDNTSSGIVLENGENPLAISLNSIHSNGDLGIDLGDDGVTANDAGDTDTGPNNLQNYPDLQNVVSGEESTEIEYNLDAEAGYYRVEFFYNMESDPTSYGEGETYMCHTDIEHTGGGSETYTVECDNQDFDNAPAPPGTYLTSTVLLCEDSGCSKFMDTSEFSESEVVKGPPIVNSSGTVGDENPGDEVCDTGDLNVNGVPECTLQAAIDEANATDIYSEIHFNIPSNDPRHYCYEDDGLAGQITVENETTTDSIDDPGCGGASIDPDYPYSWFRIPGTEYTFSDNIDIKGYTQEGANKNTADMGGDLNNVIKIEITDAEFNMNVSLSGVEGIALSTGSNKINMNAKNGELQGIFMGIDVSGTEAVGSNHQIRITDESNLVGSDQNGTSDQGEINVLNGNNSQGATIVLNDDAADNTVIANNYINTGRSGKENSGEFGSHYAVRLDAPIGNNFDNVNISENVLANNAVAVYAADGGHQIDNLKIENNRFKISWDGLEDLNNDVSTKSEVPSCIYGFNAELKIRDNVFKNCGQRNTSTAIGTAVLSVDTLSYTEINNNHITMDKIHVIGDSSSPASNLTITENIFQSSRSESVSIENINESEIIDNTFSHLCTDNTAATVVLEDSDSNKIKKNKLGLNYGGSPTANNCSVGFWIKGTSESNWVGGSLAEGNTISGYQNSTPYQDAYAIYDESHAESVNSYTFNNIGVLGTELLSSNGGGIYVARRANIVGNNIAGHQGYAIRLKGYSDSEVDSSRDLLRSNIKFNCIGTSSDCTEPLISSGAGVFIESDIQNVNIQNNTIANLEDTDDGAVIISGDKVSGVTISDNKIYNTDGLPIDLVGGEEDEERVTLNDARDADVGSNDLQNYPEITDVEYFSGGVYKIHGDLESNREEGPYEIEICISEEHQSGHGGCVEPIGKTQASSPWNMLFELEGNDGTEEIYLSALATNENGSTSEFSETVLVNEDNIIRYDIELIYPIGEMRLVDTTPQLDWNPAKYEDRVYPYVDHYEIFLDGEFYETVSAEKTELQLTRPLTLGEHSWDVVAYQSDNFEIGRSKVESFNVVEELCSFENLYPVDVSIDDQTPIFDWTENCSESGVDRYYLYVDGEKIVEVDGEETKYEFLEEQSLDFGAHEWYVVALRMREDGLVGDYGVWEEISRTETSNFEIVDYTDYLPDSGEDIDETSKSSDLANRVAEGLGGSFIYNSAVIILGSLGIIAISGVSLLELPAVFSLGISNIFVFIGGMKKGTKWGTVFDAVTKKPVRYVFVKLFDQEENNVESTVTDASGRFYFRTKKNGKFKISVSHYNYEFPSRIILQKKDKVYGNVYRGGWYDFDKQDGREMIGVPLDPMRDKTDEANIVSEDLSVYEDLGGTGERLVDEFDVCFDRIEYYGKIILVAANPVLLLLGTFANAYLFITDGGWVNLVLGLVHILLLAALMWGFVRKKFAVEYNDIG